MNKLTRTLAGIMAMATMLSFASCNKREIDLKGDNSVDQSSAIQQMAETSYKAVEVDAELPFVEVNSIMPIGNTGKLLASGYAEDEKGMYSVKGYITDADFSVFNEIDLGIKTTDSVNFNAHYAAANDGKIYAVAMITDYGDFELPDYNDPDFDYENFDYEAMEEAATYTYKIFTISESGEILTESEISGIEKFSDADDSSGIVYLQDCFALGSSKICISLSGGINSDYITVDSDGSISEPIDFGTDDYFHPYGTDRDNNFVYMTNEGSDNILKTLDAETLAVSPDSITVDTALYFNAIIKGSGEYRVYLSSSTSLYGMKDDGTVVEIINWVDSDMTGDYIQELIPVDNGDFLVTEQNWSTGTASVYRLTKRDISEIENVQFINMAVEYADPGTIERVKDFNKTNSDYRIKIADYSEYYEWDEETEKNINSPDKQLKQDIAAGKTFDIICMSDSSGIFENLSKKGALVDLYTYLDSDSELSRDDIVSTMLSVGERDGKLTSLAPSFYISTFGCKSKFFDKENWTIEEFLETCNNLPEGMKPFSSDNTKEGILMNLALVSDAFIDFDNAACDFNNPKFIELLEFCNQFPNPGEGDEIDWENATDEEMNEYWEKTESAVRDDRALLYDIYLSNPRDYARLRYGNFGEEFTFVGNPSADGAGAKIFTSGSYAIMETSNNKDACWEFIKEMFDEEYQSSDELYDFPALKSEFDKKFDEAMEKPYYLDENGKKVEYDDMYYDGVNEIKLDPLTQEECDLIRNYVGNIKASKFYYNEDVFNIILDECNSYFAGDKTAEQTAEIIQNRVSILISEQS